jgi:hypothetical protein
MATPRGARHTDLEQRLRDLEAEQRRLAFAALNLRQIVITSGTLPVTSPGQITVDGDPLQQVGFIDTDTVTATGPGDLELTLTKFPLDGSLHVYLNGVWQAPTEWALVGNVVTLADPDGLIAEFDVLNAAYAYDRAVSVSTPPAASGFEAAVLAIGAPALWATLGDAAGSVAEDATTHNRDGTYGGTVDLGQPSVAPGLPGTSADFNGLGWVDYGTGAAWQRPATFTANIWAHPRSASYDMYLFGCDDFGSIDTTRVWHLVDQTTARVYSGAAAYPSDTGSIMGRLTAGVTSMLTITFDGSTVKLYKDGALVQGTSVPGAMNTSTLWPLTIGATANGRVGRYAVFDGFLQHAILWDSIVATPSQIAAMWTAGMGL